MKKIVKLFLFATLAIVLAAPVSAADQAKKKGQRRKGQVRSVTTLVKKLEAANLDDEQSAKLKKLVAEHTPLIRAAQQKVNAQLSTEQKAALAEARKNAQAENKKGKELQAAVEAALDLSSEERAARTAAQKEAQAANAAFRKAVTALLSDEQKKAVGLARRRAKANK